MASRLFNRDQIVFSVLALVGAAMIVSVVLGARTLSTRVLEEEAEQTTALWARQLSARVPALMPDLAAGDLSPATRDHLRNLAQPVAIAYFAIHDRHGRLVYASAAHWPGPASGVERMPAAAPGRRAVLLQREMRNADPYIHALSSVALVHDGQIVGHVVADVDRTLHALSLDRGFTFFALLSAVLLLAALGVSAWLLGGRARERRRALTRIAFLARCDAVTGLYNRGEFIARLQQALHEADGSGARVAVVTIGIDRFKSVNDTLGPSVGDLVLKEVARRCAANTRKDDIVGRLGGDEMAVVLSGWSTSDELTAFAGRLCAAVAAPMELAGRYLTVEASAGIAVAAAPAEAERLVKNAVAALNWAKAERAGSIRVHNQELDAALSSRMTLELDLRRALEHGQFELEYQPQVSLKTGALVGCEALVRWRHPELGSISPERFIPIAEKNGSIFALGEWILRTACTEAAGWQTPLTLAVNLSPLQFRDSALAALVSDVLRQAALPAERLEIEVTEGLLLSDTQTLHETLQRLRGLGVGLAMDDFGKGFSSLSYLSRYPFTKLKIDRSFVHDLDGEQGGLPIIQSIIGLGHALGMKVTAEGVENESQAQVLREQNCDYGQGYLFARPMSAQALGAHIARHLRAKGGGALHVA